jgi:predicted dehydrogenase
MNAMKLRWGILGTANIARKNWLAIRNSGNNVVTAVASRSADRARAYIDANQAHAPMGGPVTAHGSYEALIADPNVDAVYVPLPTGLRKEWVLRAAAAGKHVICEKPCGTSVAELREMLEACERNGVQFMDGVMMMHSARLAKVREALEDGRSVGQLRRMYSSFSFCGGDDFLSDNIRMNSALEPDGCLGDLGWYCIRMMLWAVKWEMPTSVSARFLASQARADSPARVPTECSAELMFPGGISGSFYCSFRTADQQFMTFSGTKGYLHMPDFVLPFFGSEAGFDVTNSEFTVRGCDFNMEARTRRVTVPEYSNSMPNAQEANLYRNFAEQVRSGRLNTEWPESVLRTQQVMEWVTRAAMATDTAPGQA